MKINNKSFYIFFIIIVFVGVTIGYAVINSTLNINGKSSISKNTWDVYFDNINVGVGSVEAEKVPTIENTSTVDFEVALNLPGDYYEFTVDVVNAGSIDAMIESISKTPDLSTEQQKYLNYIIEYENGEEIVSKQLVNNESFLRLKVRVEYKSDITAFDLPTVSETLNLGFNINYVQADGNGIGVKDNGIKMIASYGSLDELGTVVKIGTEYFYTIGNEGNNVKLLSKYNLYVGNIVSEKNVVNPLDNPTGMQESIAIAYKADEIYPFIGTTAFSLVDSYYSGSLVENYVNVYKNLLESNFGVDIVEARLITSDELTNPETFNCKSFDKCSSDYPWIYSTSYWTGTNMSDRVYFVRSTGYYYNNVYSTNDSVGVRPVIIISKSLFE